MNLSASQNLSYQLLDFGYGRKLEQFGHLVLDRPCPAADATQPTNSNLWKSADLRLPYDTAAPEPWPVQFRIDEAEPTYMAMQLAITPFGHVGVFPEQLIHWRWLFEQVKQSPLEQVRALNLFAYTGGSTLAMSLAGAHVVHVDASSPSVHWARTNAELNQIQSNPIRWIVEDARKFVEREIRRGNTYDIIVLDPPSYGHGPSGKAWNLERDWQTLLNGCLQLIESSQWARLLWTGHSDQPATEQLEQTLHSCSLQLHSGRNTLADIDHRKLDAGYFIRAKRNAS